MKLTPNKFKKIIQEELEKMMLKVETFETRSGGQFGPLGNRDEEELDEEANRTPSGAPSAEARDDHAVLSGGRFPIFDKKSAESAIKLRGHNTTSEERKKIINAAAKYAPEAAKKAREEDKENK